jgi:hypothetical protein
MEDPNNSIQDFGKGLKKEVAHRKDRENIGRWASSCYLDFWTNKYGFGQVVESIFRMETDPQFFLPYEELEQIADNAVTGKWLAQQQEVKSDKKYMKITTQHALYRLGGWSSYEDHSPEGDYQLYILAELLQIVGSEELAQFLQFPEWESQAWNDVLLSKEKDVVHIYSDWGPFYNKEQKQVLSATFNIENLTKIVEDWGKLHEEDKEELIYLIVEDDGWIVVRESLEEM